MLAGGIHFRDKYPSQEVEAVDVPSNGDKVWSTWRVQDSLRRRHSCKGARHSCPGGGCTRSMRGGLKRPRHYAHVTVHREDKQKAASRIALKNVKQY